MCLTNNINQIKSTNQSEQIFNNPLVKHVTFLARLKFCVTVNSFFFSSLNSVLCTNLVVLITAPLPGLQKTLFFKPNLLGFWGIKPGFCMKAQLDGFWDFYGFSFIRMSTAR